MTVNGILLTIPLVSSASSTGERLETGNAGYNRPCVVGACASPNKKQIAHGKTSGKVKFINIRRRILKLKGVFIMMYKIEYDNGKYCNYAHSRLDLLEWLRILRDEKIDDILKISKSGDVTSVIEKYKKFL